MRLRGMKSQALERRLLPAPVPNRSSFREMQFQGAEGASLPALPPAAAPRFLASPPLLSRHSRGGRSRLPGALPGSLMGRGSPRRGSQEPLLELARERGLQHELYERFLLKREAAAVGAVRARPAVRASLLAVPCRAGAAGDS